MKKITSILLLFSILLCAVSCAKPSADKEKNAEETTTNTTTPNNTPVKQPYEDIIKEYTNLLLKKIDGKEIAKPNDSANETELALYEIVHDCSDASAMGYAQKDINDDGVDELVLLNKSNRLSALFTLKNDSPILLLNMDKMEASIASDGTVYANKYIKNKGDYTYIKKLVDGKLEGLEYGGYVVDEKTVEYYKIENGERTKISADEKNLLDSSVQSVFLNPLYNTKKTGFRFISAISDDSESNNAPVADFFSYDGILSAYKIIVESFSEYSQASWTNGKFDELFNISDNESYDVFHKIYLGGISYRPTETYFGQEYDKNGDNSYGYAKKDLNGDGVEELMLITDNYEIFAVFTMKDGKAVLLDLGSSVWIDENGYMRKSVNTGGVVGRDGEFFVYKLDGTTLNVIVGVGFKVNVYLKKEAWYKTDGKTKTNISNEEGEALYATYKVCPHDYCEDEYTRNFSGIEFVPLFKTMLATQKHINTFSNITFVNGSTFTVSAISDNDVTMSIKFVHTVGQFDPKTNPEPEVYITNIDSKAVRNGNKYNFEIDGIKGYIEFAVNSAWVTITESTNEHVACRAYLFDYPEN